MKRPTSRAIAMAKSLALWSPFKPSLIVCVTMAWSFDIFLTVLPSRASTGSSKSSLTSTFRFRVPLGRPMGLALLPGLN